MWQVLLGLAEWFAWIWLCSLALDLYFRLTLWLWFLTAEMQRKIDERDGVQELQDGGEPAPGDRGAGEDSS